MPLPPHQSSAQTVQPHEAGLWNPLRFPCSRPRDRAAVGTALQRVQHAPAEAAALRTRRRCRLVGHAPDLLSQHLWGRGPGFCASLALQVFPMLADDGEPRSAGLLRTPEPTCLFPAVGHSPACPWLSSCRLESTQAGFPWPLELPLVWDRTCEFHPGPALTSTPLHFSRHFHVVGMRKTIHFLEHRSSAKSPAERGLTGQWIACPLELGQKEARASVGVFGSVGKQTPSPPPPTSHKFILPLLPLNQGRGLGECSAPGPLQRKQFYFLGSV